MSLQDIEKRARDYADRRAVLTERVGELQSEIEAARRRHLPGIKRAVNGATEAHDRLASAIQAAPEAFEKRRTLVIAGVRVGYQKGKGKIAWDDEQLVIDRIHRHFPDRVEDLVKVTEKPVRTALGQLSVAELRKLGCEVTETDDYVLIKPTDGEVDKLVDALLKEAQDDEQVAA
ncbi:MAG: hypothetical protein RJQ08_08560 [Salinisphaeraceae bacterium]